MQYDKHAYFIQWDEKATNDSSYGSHSITKQTTGEYTISELDRFIQDKSKVTVQFLY